MEKEDYYDELFRKLLEYYEPPDIDEEYNDCIEKYPGVSFREFMEARDFDDACGGR